MHNGVRLPSIRTLRSTEESQPAYELWAPDKHSNVDLSALAAQPNLQQLENIQLSRLTEDMLPQLRATVQRFANSAGTG